MAKKKMKKAGKKGGMMPANSPAGRLMAHLPIGKMAKPASTKAGK